MKTMRTVVFPIARILVFAVIAAALVKLAFFSGDNAKADDGLTPGANFGTPHYVVGIGDVVNNVELNATVVADPLSNVVSTVDGYVGAWIAAEGQFVEAGTVVVEVRREIPAGIDANGRPTPATFTRHNLTAPISGTVHQSLLINQPAPIGTTVATINPGTLSIQGDISPDQLFQLEVMPTDAEVTITNGPAPFTCTGLVVGTPDTATNSPGDPGMGDPWGNPDPGMSSTVKATCPVAEGVRLFAGMTGTIALAAGQATEVITVPVTAVQGLYDTGRVWLVDPATGAEEPTDVVLGLSDGINIEVRSGLSEGDTILQFAPGNMEPMDPGFPGMPGMPIEEPAVIEDGMIEEGVLEEGSTDDLIQEGGGGIEVLPEGGTLEESDQ
ncbi:MAG TPA: secretion protein HlyD [Actinomycetales bacterium]|nr:secretion protein HlyD [Actinomycetales bacterium]